MRRYGVVVIFPESYDGHPLPVMPVVPYLSEAAVSDSPEDYA